MSPAFRSVLVSLFLALSMVPTIPEAEAQVAPAISLYCQELSVQIDPSSGEWGWGICTVENPSVHPLKVEIESDWTGDVDYPGTINVAPGSTVDFQLNYKLISKEISSTPSVTTATIIAVHDIPYDQHDGDTDTMYIEVIQYRIIKNFAWDFGSNEGFWNSDWLSESVFVCTRGTTYTAKLSMEIESNYDLEWVGEDNAYFMEELEHQGNFLQLPQPPSSTSIDWDIPPPSSETQQSISVSVKFSDSADSGYYAFPFSIQLNNAYMGYPEMYFFNGLCELKDVEETGTLSSLASSSTMMYTVGGGGAIVLILLVLAYFTRRVGGRDFEDDIDFDELDF